MHVFNDAVLVVNKLLFFVNVSSFVQRFLVCAIKIALRLRLHLFRSYTVKAPTPFDRNFQSLTARGLFVPRLSNNRHSFYPQLHYLPLGNLRDWSKRHPVQCELSIALAPGFIASRTSRALAKKGASEINSRSNEEDPSARSVVDSVGKSECLSIWVKYPARLTKPLS